MKNIITIPAPGEPKEEKDGIFFEYDHDSHEIMMTMYDSGFLVREVNITNQIEPLVVQRLFDKTGTQVGESLELIYRETDKNN